VLVLAGVASAAIAVQSAFASGPEPADMTQPVSGGQIVAVKMIGQGDANADGVVMSSTQWTPILAAYTDGTLLTAKFTVPAGHSALFRATLSGDSKCYLSDYPSSDCQVRVVINGQPLVPRSSGFGIPGNGDTASSAQFITPRSYQAGTYTITAQSRGQGGLQFLSNVLIVDEIRAS
jgi:hypothetical protein